MRVILGDPVLSYWELTGSVFANKVYMKNGTTQDSYSYRISYRSILCPVQKSYFPCTEPNPFNSVNEKIDV